MTAATTDKTTRPTTSMGDNDDSDDLVHRFCDKSRITSRCGKTKTDWVVPNPTDLYCAVCDDMQKRQYCSHCAEGDDT
ncbi:hypothetical protein GCM10007173_13420 [Glutamicibacter ardleyensis]|uniref:Uncharacterized protein n=1 Tax=Glutamicibacter ardleyensis TaxID=225894 RepID=A0ABQ2DGN1_9MICC|nr:hypothetical protein GCM10007173_13420 [Glutamicibacter ardleyensis]